MKQRNNNSTHYYMKSLILLNIIIILAGNFLTPLWASFVHKIGGDLRTAGNAICIFSIIIGIFTCVMGKIENELKKNEFFLVVSQAMFVIGYLYFFLIQSPWQLYLAQAWLGFAGAIQSPALYSLYQRHMPKEQSTTAWGVWNGAFNIALGLGSLISAYIASYAGFQGVFATFSFIAFLGLILAIIIAKKMLATTQPINP